MTWNYKLRPSLALLLLTVGALACGPSPELIDAIAAQEASEARAADTLAMRDELQRQVRDLEESIEHWQHKTDEAESSLSETRTQIALLPSRAAEFIRAAVSRGDHESVDADVVQLLFEDVAGVLDAAVLGAESIRSAVTASGRNGLVMPKRLSPYLEQILKSSFDSALAKDREIRRQNQSAVNNAKETLETFLERVNIVRPFELVRVFTSGEVVVIDRTEDLCTFRTKVVHFMKANGEYEMVSSRRTFAARAEVLESRYVRLPGKRYTGAATIDCYLRRGGGLIEAEYIDQLRFSIPAVPDEWPTLEVTKILLNGTASILAVNDALGQRADGSAVDDKEGRLKRVNSTVDALSTLYEAHHQTIVERVRLEVERLTSEVPEELLDMLEAVVVDASLSRGSGVTSVADRYSEQAWAEDDRTLTLRTDYRDLVQQLAEGVVQELQGEFEVYMKAREQLGDRLMAWQGSLALEGVKPSEFNIPALTRRLPRPLEPSHVIEQASRAILSVAAKSATFENALDVVKAEASQLDTVAEGAFQAADRALLDYLDSGIDKAKVEGSKAADLAGEDDPSQRVAHLRFERRDEFESFLEGMDWYPRMETRFQELGREARGTATKRVAQSIASLEGLRGGLGTEVPNSGVEGALEALRATQEALGGLDELASPERTSIRLAEGRAAAKRAFLVSSMASYFERTSNRWNRAQAQFTERLDDLMESPAEPGDVVGILEQAHAAGSSYFREASREGAADLKPWEALESVLAGSNLEGSWATHASKLRSLASRFTTDLDEYFDDRSRRLVDLCAVRFAPAALIDSTALDWWRGASSNARRTGATQKPPLLKAVQVAPLGAGSLLVCTWPLKGLARRSGLREMSVLYHLGSEGSLKQLKLTQGPLAVVSNGGDEFEVVDLSGVEEWSGKSRPKRGRRYSSGYRPEEGAVVYNSLDQRDNSSNRRRGGPMTPRMVAALRAIGIPTYKGRGSAWTDADPASMLIRESWSKLPALEIRPLEGEGQFALKTFGSRTRLGALHLRIDGTDSKGFLYTLRASDEPMAVISYHLKPRKRFKLKGFKVRDSVVFLGSGSVLIARSDGAEVPPPTLARSTPAEKNSANESMSEEEARELFNALLQAHCFTPSGAYRGIGGGIEKGVVAVLEERHDANPSEFSAFARHCTKFADSPGLFIPTKKTSSYRNHLEQGIQQLVLFIRELDREGGQ